MLTSLAFIFLLGMFLGQLCEKLRLPALTGYVVAGLILGGVRGGALLAPSLMAISPDLRKLALVIILLRAGLTLNLADLKKVGRPAVLLCFVPASFEILGCVLLAPVLLGLSRLEAAVLGAVIAAVSPAVIVPRMISLIEKKRGTEHAIPQMILAGASVDDVFVIVLFTAFCTMLSGGTVSALSFVRVPVAIVLGALAGLLLGKALARFFNWYHLRDSGKVLLFLALSFLLVAAEDISPLPFSGLLAVMATGIGYLSDDRARAERLSAKFNRLWVAAELLLFVLVGAAVDLKYAFAAGIFAVLLILLALVFRMAGVGISIAGTPLTRRERLFTAIAYTPKATVQAAIGGVPLAMGFACGETVLTVAVISILLTAPLGAFIIDHTAERLLPQ